jgi:IclR family pca regulon transcriptional regulator
LIAVAHSAIIGGPRALNSQLNSSMPSSESPPEQGSTEETHRDDFVQSLARGFAVMRAFAGDHSTLTIAEVARRCGLTRAGARRILLTLVELGYVGVERRRNFYLTGRSLELGQGFRAQPVWEAARPVLQSVVSKLNETTSAGRLDGADVVYMVRIRSSRMLHWDLNAGDRLPAYASSMGRVLLAALPSATLDKYLSETKLTKFTQFTIDDAAILRSAIAEVRQQGWCCAQGEIEESVSAYAVPLINSVGHTIAALQMHLSTERATVRLVKTVILPTLKEAAHTISTMI